MKKFFINAFTVIFMILFFILGYGCCLKVSCLYEQSGTIIVLGGNSIRCP